MDQVQAAVFAERFISAWNSQDVETVLACYTDDVVYRDPGTRGEVRGSDDLRRYLEKLLSAWEMRWTLRATYPFQDCEGAAALWHATLRKAGGSESAEVEVDGMDLVLMRGDRIARNEVYFDRAVLAPIVGATSRAGI